MAWPELVALNNTSPLLWRKIPVEVATYQFPPTYKVPKVEVTAPAVVVQLLTMAVLVVKVQPPEELLKLIL